MPRPETDLKTLLEQSSNGAPDPEVDVPETKPNPKSKTAPSREAKKKVTIPLTKDAHFQLKLLSLEKEKSIEALTIEAWNILFQMNDKPPIA